MWGIDDFPLGTVLGMAVGIGSSSLFWLFAGIRLGCLTMAVLKQTVVLAICLSIYGLQAHLCAAQHLHAQVLHLQVEAILVK